MDRLIFYNYVLSYIPFPKIGVAYKKISKYTVIVL